MQLIVSAVKIFRFSYKEVMGISYVNLMWMFKEYNEMYSTKKEDKKNNINSFKGMKGVNFSRN